MAMRSISESRSDASDMDKLGSMTQSKSWFSMPGEARVNDGTELDRRDDSENRGVGLSSVAQSSVSYGITQTFSAMIGLTSEPTRTMRSEERDDTTFDAFMDDDKYIDGANGRDIITPKSPYESEKKNAAAHATALACIADKNFKRFLHFVKNNPNILTFKTTKPHSKLKGCNGGTLLHVLVSQKPKKKRDQKSRNFTRRRINSGSTTTRTDNCPSVPENVLKFVIKTCPQALEMKDDHGRLPIHCACISQAQHLKDMVKVCGKSNDIFARGSSSRFNVMETSVVDLLLKYNVGCASIADNRGNLPVHYAATMMTDVGTGINAALHKRNKKFNPSAEDTMRKLLLAFPRGVAIKNKKGMLPLHVIASMGQDMNIECLKLLLLGHKTIGKAPTERNEDGDPPLYVALKCGATCEAIQCFAQSEHSARTFIQRDNENNNALHVALHSQYPDTTLIRAVLNIAPFAASSPDSNGVMPLKTATQLRLDTDLIRTLFTRDMPIEIGANKNRSVTPLKYKFNEKLNRGTAPAVRRHIIRRSHHHSWWYMLVECKDFYLDTVYDFLSDEATHFQIVSLARQIGPDGKSILINCVSDQCRVMFHSLLRCYDRYEILLSTNELQVRSEDIVDGVQTFLALDHGALPPINGKAYSDATSNVPYFTNAIKVEHDQESVEISLLPEDKKRVLLRTYFYEEAFYAELKVREKYNFDPSQFEEIHNYHSGENFTRLALSRSEKLCCIAFERPCHSLVDVFASVTGSIRSQKWIEKCWVVLKQIGLAVKALHDQKLVHGHLVPSNVCKFGNIWKLAQLGTVVPINTPMRGTFRSCVPPESIFVADSKSQRPIHSVGQDLSIKTKPSKRGVKFSSWALDEGKERKSSKTDHDDTKSSVLLPRSIFGWNTEKSSAGNQSKEGTAKDDCQLSFRPERIGTTVAWDMWGFGLIMVQLLTGRCMQLSNFEKAEDAVMKKLHVHDDNVLQAICDQLYSTVDKEAADLVLRLLQRDPMKRPNSMDEVLKHPYFESLTIYV